MDIKKRCPSLKIVFFEYLLAMAAAVVCAFALPLMLWDIGANSGWFTYADSAELQAKNAQPQIAASKPFDSRLVPASCSYVYLDSDGSAVESNMKQDELSHAVGFAKGEYSPATPDDCYLLIPRDDGSCVLHYFIRSSYQTVWMNSHLPNPDSILKVVVALNCLLFCFLVTTLFARRLKKQLLPLMDATRKIREQDLDFEIRPSKIKEFNQILFSFDDMKTELKRSLEKQWRLEQTKKEQTSALAHDIKTPLTIIRGNAELLGDSGLTDEQRDYTRYILKNTDRMEQYLKLLINLTKAEAGSPLNLQKTGTDSFLKDVIDQANGLASAKQIKISFQEKNLPPEFRADAGLLLRALTNVISNAVDYSPEHGEIGLSAERTEDRIHFRVTDSGKGFSPQDLKQAAERFYRGDASRSSSTHYGMGLFIAKSIAERHGGTLEIANSPSGGGQVTLTIPVLFR